MIDDHCSPLIYESLPFVPTSNPFPFAPNSYPYPVLSPPSLTLTVPRTAVLCRVMLSRVQASGKAADARKLEALEAEIARLRRQHAQQATVLQVSATDGL